jgi:DNA-directed RNA polymerase alpha subunit
LKTDQKQKTSKRNILKTYVTTPLEDTRLADLHISQPTLFRLGTAGIHTIADLIAKEEEKTKSVIESRLRRPKKKRLPNALSEINIGEKARGALLRHNIKSVPDLIAMTARKLHSVPTLGIQSFTQIVVELVQKGYADKPGYLLHDPDTVFYLQSSGAQKELSDLNIAEILKPEFTAWFSKTLSAWNKPRV